MTDWTIAACIASGPSLTEEDCEQIRAAGIPTIVTNNTWQRCQWADVLYAMDRRWWNEYGNEAKAFEGRKITPVRGCPQAEHIHLQHGNNSGYGAIALAAKFGAKKIILLGYDCQFTGGKRHWHGDHKPGMGNGEKIHSWPAHFHRLQKHLQMNGREAINCTRDTALKCFKTAPLESTIDQLLSWRAAQAQPDSSPQKALCASP